MTRSLSMWHIPEPFNVKVGRGPIESVADSFNFS